MLQIGNRFGDYTVVRLLGRGGMGFVYLLEGAEGVQVAAKILDPAEAGDHESRKRFLREAELALGVKHPNLVETYDVGEDPDTGLCYILMEYVSGGSLADYLKTNGALPVEDAVAVVQAMASVLELAREKGIVHRDIKPGNIMFDAEGTPKLADLGIARGGLAGTETTTVTQTGMMIGTPAYMAPEQMLDAHKVDTRADIYSLGVVFFEMLTGERPNKDDTVVQLMARAVKGEPLPDVRTLRPEVSASLAQLLNMMVAPDRDGRISTPGQITSALDIIARGGTFESARAKAQRREALRAERNRRRRRRRLALTSVLGVVALVGLGGIGLGIAWLLRNEGAVVETGADSQLPMALPEERPAAAVREPVVVSNAFERSDVRADPVRKPEPEVVERLVVVTNVVKEQTQSDKKPTVPSEPEKEAKGVTDLRVRSAEVDGLTWFYTLEDGNAVIWRGEGHRIVGTLPAVQPEPDGDLSVPPVLDGYKVKAIGGLAFVRCSKLTSVTIPDGVRELRVGAFCGCAELKDVRLPDSLETIRKGAFQLCRSLKSVDIGRCRSIFGSSFRNCPSLDEIRVSDDNPSYVAGDGMLLARDVPKLVFYSRMRTTVEWPEGIKEIGEGAFCGCRMREVCVPDTVEKVGDDAFSSCAFLEEVKLGRGVEALGPRAFSRCVCLRSVDLPKSLTQVGRLFADGCRSLKRIVFRGDAPKMEEEVSSGLTLGKVPEELEILVMPGTKGWNGPGSSDLPGLWPSGNSGDSRPIRYWRTEDEQMPERPADGSRKAEAVDADRRKEPNPLAIGEAESGCWVDARTPPSHRKLKPDLKSPSCNLKGSHGIEVRADKGCSTAARRLLQNLRDWLTSAERIYEPPIRKKPFVITVSRCNPNSKKSAGYFLDVDTCELWLPPDDDNFESELQYIAAVVCAVCHETEWHPFVDYGGREIRQHGYNWYDSTMSRARGRGIGGVFAELQGKCPDVFYRYQRLKHRRYVEGEIGSVIDYDTVADILSHACGEDVTPVMRRHGLGNTLRRKDHPPGAPDSAVPPTSNDGKTFDIARMTGTSFPKTLQKTLDAVFPPWRLGSDYQGAVKSMSGEVRTGSGTVRLGYLSKAYDRSHVVVLPSWFNGQSVTVLSCRRKMSEGEVLKCSLALGHGAANCSLAVKANGKDIHRMVLEEAGRWYDFDVDFSKWRGKTPRIDIEVLTNRDESLGDRSRGYYSNTAFVNIQRLEFGKK